MFRRLLLMTLFAGVFAANAARALPSAHAEGPLTIFDMQAALAEARTHQPDEAASADDQAVPTVWDSEESKTTSLPLLAISAGTPQDPGKHPKSESSSPVPVPAPVRQEGKSPFLLPEDAETASWDELRDQPLHVLERLPQLFVTTIGVLAACVLSLVVAHRWLKRAGRIPPLSPPRRLQLVATLSLPSRSHLHLVKFDDREVLVGVDSRGLRKVEILTPSFDSVLQSPPAELLAFEPEALQNFRQVRGTGHSLSAA